MESYIRGLDCGVHEVVRWGGLIEERLRCHTIVGRIVCEVPVVDESSPHCTCFPPVVWLWKYSNLSWIGGLISMVIDHKSIGDGFRR